MRCKECNVDIGESYKRCPLCGAKAVDEPPEIPGERTAEYPDVRGKKYPPNYFGIYLISLVVISVVAIAVDYLINKKVDIAYYVIFSIPCIWAGVFRPKFIKKLYFGSYIIHDLLCAVMIMLVISKRQLGSFGPAIRFGIPVACFISIAVIVAGLFASRKRRVNAAGHLIAIFFGNLALTIINIVNNYTYLWSMLAMLLCCVVIIGLFLKHPTEIKNEISARFNT